MSASAGRASLVPAVFVRWKTECIIVFNRHRGLPNKSLDKSSPAANVKQREISALNRTRAAINTSELGTSRRSEVGIFSRRKRVYREYRKTFIKKVRRAGGRAISPDLIFVPLERRRPDEGGIKAGEVALSVSEFREPT